MNKDQIAGAGKVAAGSVKDAAGKLTGNNELRAKGAAEKAVGKVQGKMGDAEAKAKHEADKPKSR